MLFWRSMLEPVFRPFCWSEEHVSHPPSPHDSLFVPPAPAEWRGAPIAGSVVLAGGIAMMVASWLPWHITTRKGIQVYWGTVMSTYGPFTLLLGFMALIAGLSMFNTLIHAAHLLAPAARLLVPVARLLARLSALSTSCIGVYHLVRILTVSTPHVVRTPAIGLYVLAMGVLLAVGGSFLQRAVPSSRHPQ